MRCPSCRHFLTPKPLATKVRCPKCQVVTAVPRPGEETRQATGPAKGADSVSADANTKSTPPTVPLKSRRRRPRARPDGFRLPSWVLGSHKYPALRIIVSLYLIAAGIAFAIAFVMAAIAVWMVFRDRNLLGFTALLPMGMLVLAGICLVAVAESIRVFLDIEENTRRSGRQLRRLLAKIGRVKVKA